MRNLFIFCFFVVLTSTTSAQSEDVIPASRVFEVALIDLVDESTEFRDGRVRLLDLNKYDDPLCITCWETFDLSERYWVQIAGQPTKAKLSDVVDIKKQVGAVFMTSDGQVGRISYQEVLLTQKSTPSSL